MSPAPGASMWPQMVVGREAAWGDQAGMKVLVPSELGVARVRVRHTRAATAAGYRRRKNVGARRSALRAAPRPARPGAGGSEQGSPPVRKPWKEPS